MSFVNLHIQTDVRATLSFNLYCVLRRNTNYTVNAVSYAVHTAGHASLVRQISLPQNTDELKRARGSNCCVKR